MKPGRPFIHTPQNGRRLHISLATLGTGAATNKSVVQCNVGEKSPVFLCSLFPGKDETRQLHLEFQESADVIFSVIGPQSVHLTGYYLGATTASHSHRHDDDETESYGEDIAESETQRSVDDSDEDKYEDSFINDDDDAETHSSFPASSGGVAEDSLERRPNNAKGGRKRLRKKYHVTESDDDSVSQENGFARGTITDLPESEEEDKLPISLLCKSEASGKSPVAEEEGKTGEETCQNGKENKEDENVGVSKRKADAVVDGEPDRENPSEPRKKKIKKNKNQENMDASNVEVSVKRIDTENKPVMDTEDSCAGNKLNGLVIEELEIGNSDGNVAAPGKRVHVRYIGKLKESGQVFDSNVDGAPLKFRIGKKKGLQFWNAGVDGMRVGGKRMLIVPPSMGYGSEGDGESVAPDSWLTYEVELIKVK